jgi:hypothetical protein
MADWPPEVERISQDDLDRLGVHKKTRGLYWDGQEIVIKRSLELKAYEKFLASLVAFATAGVFVIELGRSCGWWH